MANITTAVTGGKFDPYTEYVNSLDLDLNDNSPFDDDYHNDLVEANWPVISVWISNRLKLVVDNTVTKHVINAAPQPDHAMIRSHIEMLHTLAKSAGVDGILTLIRIDEKEKIFTERFAIGGVDNHANAVIGWSANPGVNLYAPWAIFQKDMPRGSKGGEEHVVAALAFVGDLDADTGKAGAGLDGLPVKSPYIMETSAENFQPVFPLAEALSFAEAKPIAVALSDAIGADNRTKDISGLWRIAGTLNWPTAKKLARGRSPIPQLVTVETPWTGELVERELSEILIHENADLAGMKKAEVETVKAYASRMQDVARPAFAHFVVKQPRHSIEVGTTNSSEYLQSQTGNRRFWPMTVIKAIDVEKLRHARLQLIGEAASYEAGGESVVLDESLWSEAGFEQEQRRMKDPWEDMLEHLPKWWDEVKGYDEDHHPITGTVLVIHLAGDEMETVSAATILKHVLDIPIGHQTAATTMRLSTVMKQLGWQRHKNGYVSIPGYGRAKGYYRLVSKEAAREPE